MTSHDFKIAPNTPKGVLLVRLYLMIAFGVICAIIGSYYLNGILGYPKYDGMMLGAVIAGCLCLPYITITADDYFFAEIFASFFAVLGAIVGAIMLAGTGDTWLKIGGYFIFGACAGAYFGYVGITLLFILLWIPITAILWLLMLPLWVIGYIFKLEIPNPDFSSSEVDPIFSAVSDRLSSKFRRARSSQGQVKKSLRVTATTSRKYPAQPQIFSPQTNAHTPSHKPIDDPSQNLSKKTIAPNRLSTKIDKVKQSISRLLSPSNQNENWDDYQELLILNLNASAHSGNKKIENTRSKATPNQTSSVTPSPVVVQPQPVQQNSQPAIYPLPNSIQHPITSSQPNFGTTTRAAISEVVVRQDHRQMQSEIVRCLYEQQPIARDVYMEVEGIDILVNDFNEVTILELKTGTDCVQVLREAIGQLLEYQFFAQRHFAGKPTRLVAVSPLPLDQRAAAYLLHLRNTYQLNVEYRQYMLGSHLFLL